MPATGLAIHGRVLDAEGRPIAGACVTLGPPVRCFTFTSRTADPGDSGYYLIDLGALSAPAGSTWDLHVVVRGHTRYDYPDHYTGIFVVDGVVERNVRFR